jgi:hypothetical protein
LPATIAHLDHTAGNNHPDNLAYLRWTHHWMFDADLHPIEAIKLSLTVASNKGDRTPGADDRRGKKTAQTR